MKVSIAALAGLLFLLSLSSPATAQFGMGALLGPQTNGQAGGAYQSNNQIRTYAIADAYDSVDLLGNVLEKAALMARDKNFPRFGVTKSKCFTMLVNGVPRTKSCYLIAQMVGEDEEARSKGKNPTRYYFVRDLLFAQSTTNEKRSDISASAAPHE